MATNAVVRGAHKTLSGSTADLCTFSATGTRWLRVANRDASVTMYFNVNSDTVPVAEADDTYMVAPGTSVTLDAMGEVNQMRIVSSGGGAYSAEVY